MLGKRGGWASRIFLFLVVAALVAGFTPISRHLLRSVNGSFSPTAYSALALSTPSNVSVGIPAGRPVQAELTNYTGHTKTYYWSAVQNGVLISHGTQTVGNGKTVTLSVRTRGAVSGKLRIGLKGTKIFLTVPLLRSRS